MADKAFICDKCRACDYYRDGCDGADIKCKKWTPIGEPRGTVPAGDPMPEPEPTEKLEPAPTPTPVKKERKTRKPKAKKEEPVEIVADKTVLCFQGEEVELKKEESVAEVSGNDYARAATPAAEGEESKADKFTRIAASRVPHTLDEIRKLKNLASYYERKRGNKARVYTYEWTKEQGEKIVQQLRDAVEELDKELRYCGENKEGGLIL